MTEIKELQQQVKTKLALIVETEKEIKSIRQQIKELQLSCRETVKPRLPKKRAKGYSLHASGKYLVQIRNTYLGFHLKYFNTEKEAQDKVAEIYKNAGL
jgi:hypothetical protein